MRLALVLVLLSLLVGCGKGAKLSDEQAHSLDVAQSLQDYVDSEVGGAE